MKDKKPMGYIVRDKDGRLINVFGDNDLNVLAKNCYHAILRGETLHYMSVEESNKIINKEGFYLGEKILKVPYKYSSWKFPVTYPVGSTQGFDTFIYQFTNEEKQKGFALVKLPNGEIIRVEFVQG
jgi:hypothetical protein